MNAPANISYEDRLKGQAKAIRARLFGKASQRRAKPEPARVAFCVAVIPKPAKADVEHDAHMQARMVWKAWTGAQMSPKQYFIAACWLAGYTPEIIRGPSRKRQIVSVRKAIIRSLAHRFPKMSSPKIGEFVNREYTTVLYCMGQTQRGKQIGCGSVRAPGNYQPPLSEEIRAKCVTLRKRKLTYVRIGELLGIAPSAARYSVLKHNERKKSERKALDVLKRAA